MHSNTMHNIYHINLFNQIESSGQKSRYITMQHVLHRVVAMLVLAFVCAGAWATDYVFVYNGNYLGIDANGNIKNYTTFEPANCVWTCYNGANEATLNANNPYTLRITYNGNTRYMYSSDPTSGTAGATITTSSTAQNTWRLTDNRLNFRPDTWSYNRFAYYRGDSWRTSNTGNQNNNNAYSYGGTDYRATATASTQTEALNGTTYGDITITPSSQTLDLGGTATYTIPQSISQVTRTRPLFLTITDATNHNYYKVGTTYQSNQPEITETPGPSVNLTQVNWGFSGGDGNYYTLQNYHSTSNTLTLTRTEQKTASNQTFTITASAQYGSVNKSGTATVTILKTQVNPTAIHPQPADFTLGVGASKKITYTAEPNWDAAGEAYLNITYSSNNTSVATVSADGIIKAVGKGNTTITLQAVNLDGSNGVAATVYVTVQQGTGEDPGHPYYVAKESDFAYIAAHPNYYYVVSSDFDASGNTSITNFSGSFDGGYNTISGLSSALFDNINGGTVKNVRLADVSISGGTDVGALANTAVDGARIYNCGVLGGSVSGSRYVGGLIGYITGGTKVVNNFNYASVSGGTSVAGVVGYNETPVIAGSFEFNSDNSINGWTRTGNTQDFVVNTWSGEGNNDGSGMTPPFIQNWLKAGANLDNAQIRYTTFTGLEPGTYQVSVRVRMFNESNNNTPSGAYLYVNGGTEKTINIADVGTRGTYNNLALIYGVISTDVTVNATGNLTVGFNINNAQNMNWFAFKDLSITKQSYLPSNWNDDFARGVITGQPGIVTYDSDRNGNGTTLSHMQAVPDWNTEVSQVDGQAAGVVQYGSAFWIGGNNTNNRAPATGPAGTNGYALGMVAVWQQTVQYTHTVNLPAGSYALEIPIYNSAGTTAIAQNLIGVIINGVGQYATTTTYPVGSWTIEKINFTLDSQSDVKLSLGYRSANAGNGAMPHLFIDRVKIIAGATYNMVANCVNYGTEVSGSNTYPVYGGDDLDNKKNPLYDFFLYDGASYREDIKSTNGALPAEARFLNRFEYVRATLNAEKKLAAYYLFNTQNKTDQDEIGKWVLDKEIAPYPVIKPWGKYPSLVNPDVSNRSVGTLSVNITGYGSVSLPISDQYEEEFDYGYHKVQLPYYNDYFNNNYQSNRVVTGWKITSVSGGTAGSFTTSGNNAYNFADRNCTQKVLNGGSPK